MKTDELVAAVRKREITAEAIAAKLSTHVDQVGFL
jgi:hypothetical protein